jgi:hypothetical protein
VFLKDCVDKTATGNALQRFFDWVRHQDEYGAIADRAVRWHRVTTVGELFCAGLRAVG